MLREKPTAAAERPNGRRLRRLYGEVAYCRLRLAEARGRGEARWQEHFKDGAERARRCIDSLLRPKLRRAGGDIAAEVRSWVRMVEEDERREAALMAEHLARRSGSDNAVSISLTNS